MAVLPSFATPADMEARTDGAIPATAAYLQTALDAASTRIRNACGWHIYPSVDVVDESVYFDGHGPVWLTTGYLTDVTALTVEGEAVDLTLVSWSRHGRVDVPYQCGSGVISYSHGFDEAPADLVSLTLELALGELGSRMGVLREQTLSASVTWARATGKVTAEDENALQAYKIGYQP